MRCRAAGEADAAAIARIYNQGIEDRVATFETRPRAAGFWKLVSRVFARNEASLRLCRACGFREVGAYQRHGRLDGKWLDVVIVERLIPENQS